MDKSIKKLWFDDDSALQTDLLLRIILYQRTDVSKIKLRLLKVRIDFVKNLTKKPHDKNSSSLPYS